jgi:hypothetical protein
MAIILIEWTKDNWLSILVTCLLIPLLFFSIKYLWNNYFYVIKISPVEKKINCNSESYRKEFYYVYLTNKSSNPIYDITVLTTHPKEVEVSIMPEEQETLPLGNYRVGTSFVIQGYNQNKDIGAPHTFINNLGTNETKKLKVEIDKKNYYKISNLN